MLFVADRRRSRRAPRRDPRPRCSRRRSAGGPTKRVQNQSHFFDTIVSSDPTKTAAPSEHRSERSEQSGTASAASGAVTNGSRAKEIVGA
jgi:hypothetical protein